MSSDNPYNVDRHGVFDGNGYKYDQLSFNSFDRIDFMNYSSYYGTEKSAVIDPILGSPNFGSLLYGNTIDYVNSELVDTDSHVLADNTDMICNNVIMVDSGKEYTHNVDVNTSESFSTRYSESTYDVSQSYNNISLSYNMDSLTESMLKQIETPRLCPNFDVDSVPDLTQLNHLDQQMIQRFYDVGVAISPTLQNTAVSNVSADGYYNLEENVLVDAMTDGYIIDSIPPLSIPGSPYAAAFYGNLKKKHELRFKVPAIRRRGKRSEVDDSRGSLNSKGPPLSQHGKNPQQYPTKANNGKTKNNQKGGLGGIPGYNWIKDSFFNYQVLGNVLTIAQDQTGCRMLQRQLEYNDENFIASILDEVIDHLVVLMTDPFGNYLCQKLMTVCSSEQLGRIIKGVEKDFLSICLNMHGTRAIQKLIEVVTEPEHISFVTSVLSTAVVDLVNDLNGNHVIQKCLISLKSEDCEFIYKAMNDNCVYLATHRHGCCVMQRCIDAANPQQRNMLIDTISSKTLDLVEDAFGNYVIQYVLRLKDDEINRRIVVALADNVTEFAKQKFSSNVVERCLIFCPLEVRSILISKFLNVPFDVLKELILDPFGNYVIQRVLNVAQSDELSALLDRIQPHLEELKVASSGKRIAAKITKRQYTCSDNSNKNVDYNQGSHATARNTDSKDRNIANSANSRNIPSDNRNAYAVNNPNMYTIDDQNLYPVGNANAYSVNSPNLYTIVGSHTQSPMIVPQYYQSDVNVVYDNALLGTDQLFPKYLANEDRLEPVYAECSISSPLFGASHYNSMINHNLWMS